MLGPVLAVIDIDGVVADVRHRLHHLDRGSWHRFFAAAADDALLPEGGALAHDLAREHEVVWLTGRPEWLRDTTRDWLAAHGLPGQELHMRPDADHRPARVYKITVLRRLADRGIAAFVDDDVEVIAAARDAGLPAVQADWLPRDRRSARLRSAQEDLGRT